MDRGEADAVDPKAREVLDSVLEYRQLTKIKSTYVDALPALVNASTGGLHTRYNQTGSATGRVSSNDPQRAEHPRADGARQGGAQGVRGPAGPRLGAVRGGLLADRAPRAGPRVTGPGAAGGVPQRPGHPRRHRVVRIRGAAGARRRRYEAHRQDHELRRDLRAEPIRHQPARPA